MSATAPRRRKSKVVAGFLALFLGSYGVHRFYLGQWWGVFYLLFGLLGFAAPSLYVIIVPLTIAEALVFFFTGAEEWNNKYGGGREVVEIPAESVTPSPSLPPAPKVKSVPKSAFAQECSSCAKKLSLTEQAEKMGQCAVCILGEKGLLPTNEEVVFWRAASHRGGLKGHPSESKSSGFGFVLTDSFAFYDREITCRIPHERVLGAELRNFQASGFRAVFAGGDVGRQLQQVKNYVAITYIDEAGSERTASFQIHGALSIPGEEIKATEFLNHLLEFKRSFGSTGRTNGPSAPADALRKLGKLKESGLISEQECEERRRQVLDRF